MSDDLTARLRHAWDERERQLGEDERVTLKAKRMRYDVLTDAPWERERIIADSIGGNSAVVAVHRMVAIFANPDRVLAEVERGRRDIAAKRLMVEECLYEIGKSAPRSKLNDLAWSMLLQLAEAEGVA
jgi:hypothetical protein